MKRFDLCKINITNSLLVFDGNSAEYSVYKIKKNTKQEGGFSKENPSGYQKLNFLLPILWIVYECMHLIFFMYVTISLTVIR